MELAMNIVYWFKCLFKCSFHTIKIVFHGDFLLYKFVAFFLVSALPQTILLGIQINA